MLRTIVSKRASNRVYLGAIWVKCCCRVLHFSSQGAGGGSRPDAIHCVKLTTSCAAEAHESERVQERPQKAVTIVSCSQRESTLLWESYPFLSFSSTDHAMANLVKFS